MSLRETIWIGCIFAATSLGCSSVNSNLPDQKLNRNVDLPKFMGKWYVIASIPTMFEAGAVNAVETYTWNEKDQRIDVDFRFRKDTPDGKVKVIPQKAFVFNKKTNAEWKIQLFWPLKFDYLIVDLAEDYSDTTIGVPSRGNVWIMARQPSMAPARYDAILERLKFLGYDLESLKKVAQIWE